MPFNPDEYLKKSPVSSFDPDAYLGKSLAPASTMTGGLKAAGLGAGESATLGYLPKLSGLGNKYLSEKIPTEQQMQTNIEEARNQYPKSYLAGGVAGAVAPMAVVPELGIAKAGKAYQAASEALNIPKIGKLFGIGGRAAELGAQGGLIGAVAKPQGQIKDNDPLQIAERIKNAKSGAETGALMSVGSDALVKGLQSLPAASKSVKDFASRVAVKALGPYQRDVLKMKAAGQLEKVGETSLKEGIVGGLPTSFEGLADRATEALDKKGKQFELVLNKIADGNQTEGLAKNEIAKYLTDNLQANEKIGGISSRNKRMQERVQDFLDKNPDSISIKNAQALKQDVGKEINWDRLKGQDIPEDEQYLRSLYHALNEGVENAANDASQRLGPNIASEWQKVKQEYGAIKTASIIADKRAGREFANRFISPSDYMSGGVGLIHGGPIAGAALAGLNHLGRKYGNQIIAPLASQAGQALQTAAPLAEKAAGLIQRYTPGSVGTRVLRQTVNPNQPGLLPNQGQ